MEQTIRNKDTKVDRWLEEMWRIYSPQIYNLCRMNCGSREDALDVLQNVALRFCQNAKKIKYGDSIYPWLFQVFRNCFYDYARHRQKQAPFSVVSDVMGDYMALPIWRCLRKNQFFIEKEIRKMMNWIALSVVFPGGIGN